jgi:NAD(P)-dependent dehydrogenase (short-subunit alcohol dehydrogenase family)
MSSMGILRTDWTPGELVSDSSAYLGLKVAIFGGTGGLGQAISEALLANGADVTVLGRTLKVAPHPRRSFVRADFSSLVESRAVARQLAVETYDVVLLTHGIFAGPTREITSEGLEKDLATSALSRWAVVREIGRRLGRNRPSGRAKPRLFVWGFPGGERRLDFSDIQSARSYRWQTAHSNTVVLNEALVRYAAGKFPELNVFGMNPGIIKTNIMAGLLGQASLRLRVQRVITGLLFQSAETYAGNVLPLAVHPALENRSGALFSLHGKPIEPNPWLVADDNCARVIAAADALVTSVLARTGPSSQI